MRGVDVTCLHTVVPDRYDGASTTAFWLDTERTSGEDSRYHVSDKLVGGNHRLLEKVDDHRVEPVSKLRVTLEGRLPTVNETGRVSLQPSRFIPTPTLALTVLTSN